MLTYWKRSETRRCVITSPPGQTTSSWLGKHKKLFQLPIQRLHSGEIRLSLNKRRYEKKSPNRWAWVNIWVNIRACKLDLLTKKTFNGVPGVPVKHLSTKERTSRRRWNLKCMEITRSHKRENNSLTAVWANVFVSCFGIMISCLPCGDRKLLPTNLPMVFISHTETWCTSVLLYLLLDSFIYRV